MRRGAEGRTRLLLIILIVTALFLITLDLRGVGVLEGARQASQTILSPFQRVGTVVLSPIKNLISDITQLGRTIQTAPEEKLSIKRHIIGQT